VTEAQQVEGSRDCSTPRSPGPLGWRRQVRS